MKSIPISEEEAHAIDRILTEGITDFSLIIRLLRLQPNRSFRCADLEGVDFGDSDPAGFDLTHARLRGAKWSHGLIVQEPRLNLIPREDSVEERYNFDEAKSRIELVEHSKEEHLDLSDLLLRRLPPNIAALKHLRSLDLSGNRLDGKVLNILSELSSLSRLVLARNPLDAGGSEPISHLTQLTEIDLSKTGISDLRPLIELPKLSVLRLCGCSLERFVARRVV